MLRNLALQRRFHWVISTDISCVALRKYCIGKRFGNLSYKIIIYKRICIQVKWIEFCAWCFKIAFIFYLTLILNILYNNSLPAMSNILKCYQYHSSWIQFHKYLTTYYFMIICLSPQIHCIESVMNIGVVLPGFSKVIMENIPWRKPVNNKSMQQSWLSVFYYYAVVWFISAWSMHTSYLRHFYGVEWFRWPDRHSRAGSLPQQSVKLHYES